jgi:phosphate uptake regulator
MIGVMPRNDGLDKNFQFLAIEVVKQVERTERLLRKSDPVLKKKIKSRDDYIDHLKATIENKCFAFLRRNGNIHKRKADRIRSINVITTNLERIADHAVNIVVQTSHFDDERFFSRYDYHPFFERVEEGLGLVFDAFHDSDASKAMRICETELELDDLYRTKFDRILAELEGGQSVPNLVTSLFIFHYLERMGDCLLNIGEAILMSKMGEKLKIRQYRSLREGLANVRDAGEAMDNLSLEVIQGTQSGCQISKVTDHEGREEDEDRELICKEGDLDKLLDEKTKIEKWETLVPGLPPRVVEFREDDGNATLIYEYIKGSTLQEIIFNLDGEGVEEALHQVQSTVMGVWLDTMRMAPAGARFMEDLAGRLDDVFKVHPRFDGGLRQICSLEIPDLASLVHEHRHLDDDLVAPFSVFCHGDFNLDNVIYNGPDRQVHFIDVHRSGVMDYVRDVAVFIVSCFRLPVFESEARDRLDRAIASIYRFAWDFSFEQEDGTFDARLALGLARSFIASTRFELDDEFAMEMMLRGGYLLDRVISHHGRPWEEFVLPQDVLFY